jgi:hypothetical protein
VQSTLFAQDHKQICLPYPLPYFGKTLFKVGGANIKVAGILTSRPSISQFGVYPVWWFTTEGNASANRPMYLSNVLG